MEYTSPGGLRATVDPARGGKIVSIRGAEREWLVQGDPHARSIGAQAAFTEAEMCGWDECAPTISACELDGRSLPDHGDLWNRVMDTEGTTVRSTGTSHPYRFERKITASPRGGIRLAYAARSSNGRIPFLWAAHPQFTAPSGTRVELGDAVARVVDVSDAATPVLDWTDDLGVIDAVGPGGKRKLYVHPDEHAPAASLVAPSGEALTMRWSSECRYLGLWFDNAAVNPRPVIAIEPSLAYFDALRTAVELGRAAWLDATRPLTWWVDLDVAA